MASPSHNQLARRERQIMEIVYRLGQAAAAEVLASYLPARRASRAD